MKSRVIKVVLHDAQTLHLPGIKPGAIVTIRGLSIQRSEGIQGRLDGNDRLIELVSDLSCEYAQMLLRSVFPWRPTRPCSHECYRRREKWEREILQTDSEVSAPFYFDLDQALAPPTPSVFRVLARVSDYYPFDIEDACVLTCPKCKPR